MSSVIARAENPRDISGGELNPETQVAFASPVALASSLSGDSRFGLNGFMAMKVQTKRWLFAVSVAGSLLATLFYLDRSAPAAQFTQVQSSGHSLSARAPQPQAESVREPYIVQVGRAATQPPR
jgi:hypothetical protein